MDDLLTDDELGRLVDAWIAYQLAENGSPESESNEWADDLVNDCRYGEGTPEKMWQFITAAYKCEMPEQTFAILAAGALEDLLADHGTDYIESVEELARLDPKFNKLLGGVWKNSMTDDVWHRVQAIRNEVW